MYFLLHRLILICLAASWLIGCSNLEHHRAKPSAKPVSKEEKTAFRLLEKNSRKKSINEALKDIDSFLLKNNRTEVAFAAYLLKARLLSKQNRRQETCETYKQATQLPFAYKNQYIAYFASAKCLFENKHLKEALKTLEFIIQSPKESLDTKGRAALRQWSFIKNQSNFNGWKLKTLSSLIQLFPKSPNLSTWQDTGTEIIDNLTTKQLLLISRQATRFSSFTGYLFYKAGLHFWNQKNTKKAQYYLSQSLSSRLAPKTQKEVKYYLSMLSSIKRVNPYSIGVILPLSGPKQILGERILRSLYIGFDLEKDSPWQLIVMDSKGHPDVTKESVKKLLHKYHIIGLIGGVGNESAEIIADLSSRLGVPSVLFSQKANLTTERKFVFQSALTSHTLTNHLLETINKKPKLKFQKIAILAPNDSYGKEYTKIFSEKFKSMGGEITKVQTYKSGEVDFNVPIKKLVDLYDIKERKEEYEKLKKKYLKKHGKSSNRSKNLNPEKLLKPHVDFEALFIPDSFKTVKKIGAHLKYYGIKDLHLLGTNLWSKKQISRWSKARPLIFINTPELSNADLKNSYFFNTYKKTFSSSPKFFEEQAYNTAVAFKEALKKKVKNRLELQEKLEELGSIEGAFFNFKISKTRQFIYPLTVFMTKDNQVITLDSIPVP